MAFNVLSTPYDVLKSSSKEKEIREMHFSKSRRGGGDDVLCSVRGTINVVKICTAREWLVDCKGFTEKRSLKIKDRISACSWPIGGAVLQD